MATEEADMFQDNQAAGHGVALGPIRAGIVAWDTPASLDEAFAVSIGDNPPGRSHAVIGTTVADQKESRAG